MLSKHEIIAVKLLEEYLHEYGENRHTYRIATD